MTDQTDDEVQFDVMTVGGRAMVAFYSEVDPEEETEILMWALGPGWVIVDEETEEDYRVLYLEMPE